jgi:hypothetical protein
MPNTSPKVDEYLSRTTGWQLANLQALRAAVHAAAPDIREDVKWNIPVFMNNSKAFCAMAVFKDHTKFNFFDGAQLQDPAQLFNNGFDSKRSRSIDLTEGAAVDSAQLTALITQAVALTTTQ